MPRRRSSGSSFLTNVLQAVAISLSLAALGAIAKMYLDVHDLKLFAEDQKGKIDWLYKYNFPQMEERDESRSGRYARQ